MQDPPNLRQSAPSGGQVPALPVSTPAARRLGSVLPPTERRPARLELEAPSVSLIPAARPAAPTAAPVGAQAIAPRAFPPVPGKWLSPWEIERFHLRRAGNLAGFSVLLDLALQLILGLLLGAMATLAVRYAVPPVQIGGTTLVNLLTLVIYPVSMLLPTLVLKSGARLTFAQACSLRRPQRGYCLPTVALVLGLSTVGVLLDTLISSFFQRFGVVPSTTLNSLGSFSPLDIALYVVLLVLLPPLLEEFLFRGALLQLLRPFGDGFAIVLSAVLFALAHGNLVQAPTALLVGLALGFVTVRSGSIWPAVLGHFANNAVAVAGDLALTFVQPPLQSILQLTLHLVWLALGLAALLVLLLRRPDALRLRPPRTRETTAAKAAVVFSRPGMVVFLLVTAAMIVTNFQVLG